MTQPRSGKSLLELVVVLTVMVGIVGVAGTLLHVVMRSASAGATSFAVTANRVRLAGQFRDDVHAAHAAEVVPGDGGQPDRLRLPNADESAVIYGSASNGIVREVVVGQDVRSRETYVVARGETRFTVSEAAQVVELIHTSTPKPSTFAAMRAPAPPEFRVEAVVGRDARFRMVPERRTSGDGR